MEMFRLDAQRRQRHSALQELSEDELVRRLEDKYSRRSPRRSIDDDDIGMGRLTEKGSIASTLTDYLVEMRQDCNEFRVLLKKLQKNSFLGFSLLRILICVLVSK